MGSKSLIDLSLSLMVDGLILETELEVNRDRVLDTIIKDVMECDQYCDLCAPSNPCFWHWGSKCEI